VNTLTLRSELPPSTPAGLELVERIGQRIRAGEQVPIATHHVLHAGVYSRTICIPAGVALEGALIKIPTTLIICGRAVVLLGDGEEGRKQAYRAHADTWITMSFRTQATTVEQAEAEFTDQADQLMSRTGENVVVITGD
jgi:hypothetical protein